MITKEFPNYTLYHLPSHDIRCDKTGFVYITDKINNKTVELNQVYLEEIIEVLNLCVKNV